MEKIHIDFFGNNIECSAEVELEGISDSWIAHATVNGHPTVNDIHVNYRLGQFLMPYFVSKNDLQFFSPLLDKIDEEAKILLPKKYDKGN